MTRWIQFDPTWADSLEPAAGVYVILRAGQPLYIGQSESVQRRVRNYRIENICGPNMTDGHTRTPWGNYCWTTSEITGKVKYANRYGENLMLEARLIRKLRPAMNLRGL